MQSRLRQQIVAGLQAEGLEFRTFCITHHSPHTVADWDWNQRDLSHIPFVHGGFRLVPLVVGGELAAGMFVQRIFGMALPLGVTYHHPQPGVRVYTTTLGPLALVVEATLLATVAAAGEGAKVCTTYSVGTRPLLRWILPAAEWFLRRNYDQVHAEDEPLRKRRGQLRSWGYRFLDEDVGYEQSLHLDEDRVGAPTVKPSVIEVLVGESPVSIGRDDHLGLRVVPTREAFLVFPRMCMHEGRQPRQLCSWRHPHLSLARPAHHLSGALRARPAWGTSAAAASPTALAARLFATRRAGGQQPLTPARAQRQLEMAR